MRIKKLEGRRWFIWAIVVIVAAGIALVAYISYTENDYSTGWTVVHQEKTPLKKK